MVMVLRCATIFWPKGGAVASPFSLHLLPAAGVRLGRMLPDITRICAWGNKYNHKSM